MALADGEHVDVLARDAIDDAVRPQEDFADVLAPQLGNDTASERNGRGELCMLDEPADPALGRLSLVTRDVAEDISQVFPGALCPDYRHAMGPSSLSSDAFSAFVSMVRPAASSARPSAIARST